MENSRSMALLWVRRQNDYKEIINGLISKEKDILATLANLPVQHTFIKKLELLSLCMDIISYYVLLSDLSKVFTKVKSELYLNEARKYVFKALIYTEEVVSAYIDVPFSEYEERLKVIANFPDEQRLILMNKLGYSIDSVIDALGENSKWKWSYPEWKGRYAVVLKNFIDLKKYVAEFDPRSVGYQERFLMMRRAKSSLSEVADAYRQKYELTSQRIDDIKLALQYLGALKRIHAYLGENEDVEAVKKKYEVWKAKMEDDLRKQEHHQNAAKNNKDAANTKKKGFFGF